MPDPLQREAATHQYLRAELLRQFPDADEETLLGTLEGLTNLNEMIAAVVRSRLDDKSFVVALQQRIKDMQERCSRLQTRIDKKGEVLVSTMERTGVEKITEEDFSISLRETPAKLVIVDEKEIPADYFIPQEPALNRSLVKEHLKDGHDIPGALLGNSRVTLSVRTK